MWTYRYENDGVHGKMDGEIAVSFGSLPSWVLPYKKVLELRDSTNCTVLVENTAY